MVSWTQSNAPQHAYLQTFEGSGRKIGRNQVISIDEDRAIVGSQHVEFAELDDGSFVAVWSNGNALRTANFDIYARVLKKEDPDNLPDQDGDGIPDRDDDDIDGDGCLNDVDAFPRDALECSDSDGDGIGDNKDRDDDDDGLPETQIVRLNQVTQGDQINPALAALPNNRFAMIYSDRAGNDGNKGGIFGGIYDANLTLVQDCGVINTITNEWQAFPHVAAAPNGTFMAVWTTGWMAHGQRFSPSCEKLGDQFDIGFSFNGLDVASDSNGDFWVVRSHQGKGYLDKYNNAGEQLVDGVIYYEAEAPIRNVITVLEDGHAVVGWYNGNNPGGSDAYGLMINANGTIAGEPFLINQTRANNQRSPLFAALPGGGFVAVWESFGQGGALYDIYGRVFGSDGTGSDEFWISEGAEGNHMTPFVTPRADGGFAVGWTNQTAPQHVVMRSYDTNGTPRGPSQLVSLDDARLLSRNRNIEVVELSDGRLLLAWDAIEGRYTDIFARTLASETAPAGPDFDGDGIPDAVDEDDDNDGIPDFADMFPTNSNDFADLDGDGIGDNADSDDDGDGLADLLELAIGAFAFSPDSDGDGVLDGQDAFPTLASETADNDNDGIGDNADPDDDNDGLSDERELELGTNPLVADSDGDSVPDSEELELGLDPLAADCPGWRCTTNRTWLWHLARQRSDSDGDGLTFAEERQQGLDPASADTDGDGLPDGQEIILKTNPLAADTDRDGLQDGQEVGLGTNPLAKDSDGDSVDDGEEVEMGLNPLVEDCPAWLCRSGLPKWLYIIGQGRQGD